MPAEKSSSPKKSAKKEEEQLELKAAPVTLKEPANPEMESVTTENVPDKESELSMEQLEIIEMRCHIEELEAGMTIMIQAISKIGVLTGQGNHLKEFGIERWNPSKKDMKRF